MHHSKQQEVKRYGQNFNHDRLIEKIRSGEAKFACWGNGGRPIYDVPYQSEFNTDIVVRCVVNKELTVIITVLPPKFRAEQYREARKRINRQRKFIEDDDDENS